MEATVTKPFKGVRDGEIYPVQFAVGDTVTGKLARIAVSQSWATTGAAKTPAEPVAEPKRVTRRGRKS